MSDTFSNASSYKRYLIIFQNLEKSQILHSKTCQTLFLVKNVSDHFWAIKKHVRHVFKCQNCPKFPGVCMQGLISWATTGSTTSMEGMSPPEGKWLLRSTLILSPRPGTRISRNRRVTWNLEISCGCPGRSDGC